LQNIKCKLQIEGINFSILHFLFLGDLGALGGIEVVLT
jgi:hypothetical protein